MRSQLFWCGLGALFICLPLYSATFVVWLQERSFLPFFAILAVGELHYILHDWPILVLAAAAVGVPVLQGAVIFFTSSYLIEGDDLIIRYGWLNPISPAGRFRRYKDPVPLAMVYDCDIEQTPIEALGGAGTVHLKMIDQRLYSIPAVISAAKNRAVFLSRRNLRDMRIIGRL